MRDKLSDTIKERGGNYGHPIDHFSCTKEMYDRWEEKRELGIQLTPPKREAAFRHGVYMLIDKIVRAGENPNHADNYIDLPGYSHCIEMVLEVE